MRGTALRSNNNEYQASTQPQTVVATVGTDDFVPYPIATNCYWMINVRVKHNLVRSVKKEVGFQAPVGKKVVFTLTATPASCVKNCVWQGIEIILGSFDTYGIT